MDILLNISVRVLALAFVAFAAIVIFRLKSAASRHAVWTLVTAGMLVLALCEPLLPPLPLRILKPIPEASPITLSIPPAPATSTTAVPAPPTPQRVYSWTEIALGAYALVALIFLLRLAFSYLFTLRLLRASHPIDRPWADGIHESSWISVPLTLGFRRPKILLPLGWDTWDNAKLQAVLAHERTHIERADWAIAVIAGINRAIFWFHPLAWWLERHLATLAEQACDDAALQLVDTAPYAQALLDMATAVKTSHGRLVWEAMAMANVAEVKRRIERILDETRQIPRALSRKHWAALLGAGLPLIYIASVIQLAPAEAQQPSGPTPAIADMLKSGHTLNAGEASALEQYLQTTPQDVNARAQLIMFYFNAGIREPRLTHIFWLIANRPDSSQALFTSRGLTARTTTFNDASDFSRALTLWKQQASAQSNNAEVVGNAVDFLTQAGGDLDEAERLARQFRQDHSANDALWAQKLAKIYSTAILGTAGDRQFTNINAAFAARVRSELETSQDRLLLQFTGGLLVPSVKLDEHPLLVQYADLGKHYLDRARQLGGFTMTNRATTGAPPPPPPPPAAVAAPAAVGPAPTPITKVDPVYPPLALQARIQGIVKINATIGADGRMQHLQIISGHPILVPAALDAVKQWAYAPGSSAGNFEIDVPFSLPPRSTPPDGQNQANDAPRMGKSANGIPTIRIGGAVQSSKLIHKVDPVYPAIAKNAGIEGEVVLEITIGLDGKVQNAVPKEGNPILATAAVDAVKQWEYSPTLLNGEPCVVLTQVTVTFP